MSRVRTHYDNLKVARNAPPEVIRAAYRALTQKYHPDKNPDDAGAGRIMHIINSSYEVLSDPERRSAHDIWIANIEKEADAKRERRWRSRNSASLEPDSAADLSDRLAAEQQERRRLERLLAIERQRMAELYSAQGSSDPAGASATRRWLKIGVGLSAPILVVLVLLILAYKAGKVDAGFRKLSREIPRLAAALNGSHPIAPRKTGNRQRTSSASCKAGYVRPATAPNGLPWPREAEYMPGSKVFRNKGLSIATIDNTRNDSDVLAKLVAVGQVPDFPSTIVDPKEIPTWQFPQDMRIFFIPARSSFTLRNIDPGTYQVQYQDLDQGVEWKSASFTISETPPPNGVAAEHGVNFSRINMMLYRGPAESCDVLQDNGNPGSETGGSSRETLISERAPLWYLSNKTVHDRFDAE